MGAHEVIPVRPITPEVIEELRSEQRSTGPVANYPAYVEQQYLHSQVRRSLFGLAPLVEPVDRMLGADPAQPYARAFYRGSLLGLRVTAACVTNVDAAFDGIKLTIRASGDEDDYHARHILAQEVMNLGQDGYEATAEVFDPLFLDWDDQLVPDVSQQMHLHAGFGLPISYLFARAVQNEKAQRRNELASMARALERPDQIDWDELLR